MVRYRGDAAALERRGFQPVDDRAEFEQAAFSDVVSAVGAARRCTALGMATEAAEWLRLAEHFQREDTADLLRKGGVR